MNFNLDVVSAILKRAFDILFLSNPFVTSMGLLLGIFLAGIIPAFAPAIQNATGIDLSVVPDYTWIVLGVFLLNLKSLISRPKLPEDVKTTIAVIEEARKRGISDLEVKQKYRNLVQMCSNRAMTTSQLEKEVERLRRQLGGD